MATQTSYLKYLKHFIVKTFFSREVIMLLYEKVQTANKSKCNIRFAVLF